MMVRIDRRRYSKRINLEVLVGGDNQARETRRHVREAEEFGGRRPEMKDDKGRTQWQRGEPQ
jgi:hypothetical protein